MTVQVHPNVLMKPAGVGEWDHRRGELGTTLVINDKLWPAQEWKSFAVLWSGGAKLKSLEALFAKRGYTPAEIEDLRALLTGNPFILSPIERSLFVLGGIAARDNTMPGGFRISHTSARAVDIVQAANRILCALALPQITYPSAGEA